MISELRLALATANEKIQCLESASAQQAKPIASAEPSATETPEAVCSRCANTKEDAPVIEECIPPFLPIAELKKMRDEWNSLFHERREIQHKVALLDQMEKEFQDKIALRNLKNDRVEIISISTIR